VINGLARQRTRMLNRYAVKYCNEETIFYNTISPPANGRFINTIISTTNFPGKEGIVKYIYYTQTGMAKIE